MLAQMKKNAELEKTKGWRQLDWDEMKARGYKPVRDNISNHETFRRTR